MKKYALLIPVLFAVVVLTLNAPAKVYQNHESQISMAGDTLKSQGKTGETNIKTDPDCTIKHTKSSDCKPSDCAKKCTHPCGDKGVAPKTCTGSKTKPASTDPGKK